MIVAARSPLSQATGTFRAEDEKTLGAGQVVPAPRRAEPRVFRRLEPGFNAEASAGEKKQEARNKNAPAPAGDSVTAKAVSPALASASAQPAPAAPAPAAEAEVTAGAAASSQPGPQPNLPDGSVRSARREAAPAAVRLEEGFALLPKAPPSRPAVPLARWTLTSSPAGGSNLAAGSQPTGQVQRSLDGGQTWGVVPIAEGVSFRAVFAAGDGVWAGGSNGALYHSSDGGDHWTRVRVGDDAGEISGDIVAINFSDTDHGRVTTSDGVTWMTADGGRHWQASVSTTP